MPLLKSKIYKFFQNTNYCARAALFFIISGGTSFVIIIGIFTRRILDQMASFTKKELREKWEDILTLLTDKMEKLKVDTFFRPLEPYKLSEKDQTLYLSCISDDSFFNSRISKYENELNEVTEKVFGRPYKIAVTDKEAPAASPEQEADERYPNYNYTFESFVAGPNNRLALAACQAVADGYSRNYNPLFLYGGSGLGKTHLMHPIWQYVRNKYPKKKVLYVSSETFTNELIIAIQNNTQQSFRDKYRKVDYFLFDDVQFIKNRESTEAELFNTFDALYQEGKQVIFSSDKAPKDLGDIPERLVSRFSWGMIADIQPPDYETRVAILKNKAILSDIDLSEPGFMDVVDVIAQGIHTNIRELESALTRVVAYASLTGENYSKALAKNVLSDFFDIQEKVITPSLVKKTVANYFNVKVSELEGPKRSRNIAYPRQIAIYLIRENTDCSLPKIGELFGKRDHSTILHSYEKMKEEISSNQDIKTTVDAIIKLMNS